MKTCTQISDFGYGGKINVVSPGNSAKRASPTKRAGPPPCKLPLTPPLTFRAWAFCHVSTFLPYLTLFLIEMFRFVLPLKSHCLNNNYKSKYKKVGVLPIRIV